MAEIARRGLRRGEGRAIAYKLLRPRRETDGIGVRLRSPEGNVLG